MTWLSDDAVVRLRDVATRPDFEGTRYTVLREIARGGMGVVYEAIDRELNRHVAIKVMSAAGRREAELIAGLEHPGIIPIHDAGALPDGRAFYVMKLVRGTTLSEKPRSIAEAVRLCVRISEPVAFAHARGVVHRDLKPSNIMLGEFGEVLVMDWGVSVAGTPGYMAPEDERTPRSDVFALGAMLREFVNSQRVPRRLQAIVAKATAHHPNDRYASAREFAEDLVRFLDDQPVAAYAENALDVLMRWLNRNRALLAVIGAYLVMRIVVLLVWHR
ncbi:MAG TPA: protein kinase [Thermoanaerobaculia bacterium]|nr:protein kinase [Thermoanaerobaculia bacterium]